MNLYFCMGDAAALAPDSQHYTNKTTVNPISGENDNPTEYQPLGAIMYNGTTAADAVGINVVNASGNPIQRVGNISNTIVGNSNYVEKTVLKHNGSS